MTSVGRRKGAPPAKAANRERLPVVLLERSHQVQATFERDYEWAANQHPDPRIRADIKKGGRRYAAAMWLAYRDTLYAHGRRRKAPGECHDAMCRCAMHRRTTSNPVLQLAEAIERRGPAYA